MKFYEAKDPYYALIMAYNEKSAREIYKQQLGPLEDDELLEEVEFAYAVAKFSRCTAEDGSEVPISEVLLELKDLKEKVLIVDGALL